MAKATLSLLGSKNAEPKKTEFDFFIPSSAQDRALSDLPTDRLRPDPNQPRKAWSVEDLDELESRIRPVNRIIQPIVVREDPERKGYYLIKAGEGRWRVGSERMNWTTLPCIIEEDSLNTDERKIFAEQVLENLGRVEMSPVHTAQAIHHWMNDFEPKKTAKEAAEEFGLSQTSVSRLLKLIDAPEDLKALTNKITNLNTLASLKDLYELDASAYRDAIERINNNSYPNAETELRKSVTTLRNAKKGIESTTTETSGSDSNTDTLSAQSEKKPKRKSEKKKPTEPDPEQGSKEPALFADKWQETLLTQETDAQVVKDLSAIATSNGDGLIQLTLVNGQTVLIKLDYQNQLKMSAMLNRCLDIQ